MNRLARFWKPEDWGSIKLLGGAAGGQLIALLTYPILTRLYAPADLGMLSVYTSLVGMIVVGAAMTFDQAIPLPHDEADALGLLGIALVSATVVAALTMILMLGLPAGLLKIPTESHTLFAFLVSAGVLLVTAYNVLSMLSLRLHHYGRLAATRTFQTIPAALIQVVGGILGLGPFALIVGYMIGRSAGSINLAKGIRHSIRGRFLRPPRAYLTLISRYRRFAYIGLPSVLVSASAAQLPVALIAAAYGLGAAGFFGLAVLVLSAPVELLGRSSAQVFYSESAAVWHGDRDQVRLKLLRTTVRLLAIAGIPMLSLTLIAEQAVTAAFGAAWSSAGSYVAILSCAYLASLVAWPASQLYLLLERQGTLLLLNIFRLVVSLVSFGWLPRHGAPIKECLAWFSAGMTGYQLLLFFVSFALLTRQEKTDTRRPPRTE